MKKFKQVIACTLLVGMIPMVASAQAQAKISATQVQKIMAQKPEMMMLLKKEMSGSNGAILKTNLPAVEEAVKKLNGAAVIEVGKRKFDLRGTQDGGVLVGSGADGLVATSNESASGSLLITPPLQPKTSITVTGRVGSQSGNVFCAKQLKTNSDGSIIKGETDSDFINSLWEASSRHELAEGCQNLNKTMRLSAGLYAVFFNGSKAIVMLTDGENKIIPLRELSFPKVQDEMVGGKIVKAQSVAFTVATDGGSEIEKSKLDKFRYASYASTGIAPYSIVSGQYIDLNFADRFVSVLPGSYSIFWVIDNSPERIDGYVVE